MDVRVEPQRKLIAKELMFLNCGALESPLACKETKQISPKGNQPCIFIERTDAEAEASILWPPGAEN